MTNSFNLKSLSLVAIATVSIAFSALQPANAAEQEDGRVRAALTKAGVDFQVTKDKTFKVIIKLPGGRTQVVLIDSSTEKLKGGTMEFRQVYSIAHIVQGELPAGLSKKMLSQSQDTKIGAWGIVEGSGKTIAIFNAKVDAELNDINLVKIINTVGLFADMMESEISGKDDY